MQTPLVPTLLGLGLLMAITFVVLYASRTPAPVAPALAILRGAVQLAAISLILSGVITDPFLVGVALLVMFTVAAFTATRRLGWTAQALALVAGAMAAGIVTVLTVVFVTGAIEFAPRYVLAIGGIVIGNSMTIATLAGTRFLESVGDRWDEVEAWLALGATPRQSTNELARRATHTSLVPATDQTKTTGLVTLPGAFVGAIFGGVSPLEAGRFQIVVLGCILATGAITAVMTAHGLAGIRVRPGPAR
jgi:putative ABC transport system permease protein